MPKNKSTINQWKKLLLVSNCIMTPLQYYPPFWRFKMGIISNKIIYQYVENNDMMSFNNNNSYKYKSFIYCHINLLFSGLSFWEFPPFSTNNNNCGKSIIPLNVEMTISTSINIPMYIDLLYPTLYPRINFPNKQLIYFPPEYFRFSLVSSFHSTLSLKSFAHQWQSYPICHNAQYHIESKDVILTFFMFWWQYTCKLVNEKFIMLSTNYN